MPESGSGWQRNPSLAFCNPQSQRITGLGIWFSLCFSPSIGMKSLETLTMEHALIGRGLGALEIVARKEESGAPVPKETVIRLLEFFETFGDRYHHIKEEHVLIPRLEDGCGSRAQCHCGWTIGDVYYEHEVGRHLLSRLKRAAADLDQAKDGEKFAMMAADYINFLRNHSAKEKDHVLRAASWKLPAEDDLISKSFGDYASREAITKTPRDFASEIDSILAELSIEVPASNRSAYSRGTIPSYAGTIAF